MPFTRSRSKKKTSAAQRHSHNAAASPGGIGRKGPLKPKPKRPPGKRSEVNDSHDRYANIEVQH